MHEKNNSYLHFDCRLASSWTIADADAFEIITRDMVEKEMVTKTDLIRTVDNFTCFSTPPVRPMNWFLVETSAGLRPPKKC